MSLREAGVIANGGGQTVRRVNLEDSLIDLLETIGEAALDPGLWSLVLIRLADSLGAGQVAMASLDDRTKTFASIVPRTDPADVARYESHWAFHNPAWTRSTVVPVGKTFSLDSLIGQKVFTKTPIFNEWWQPAGWGLGLIGANLLVEDQLTALICVDNGPLENSIEEKQVRAFEFAVQHILRAVRIQRKFCTLELEREAAADHYDVHPHGILLVDGGSRVVFANPSARALLASGSGLVLRGNRLEAAEGGALSGLIASCVGRPKVGALKGRGGDLEVARGPGRTALKVSIMPLSAEGRVAELPWLGLRAPVAIVTIADPDLERRRLEQQLRDTFGLTPAESSLAAEIAKGDGRKAAAERRGVALSTARAQLSSIFEKTGTRRQAELVRLVHNVTVRVHRPEARRESP
jgi:DNA-binding CsgD family transcriptional regulator/PAS domain-containing protein